MSAPPFTLVYTKDAEDVLVELAKRPQDAAKLKQVKKALRFLRDQGPRHSSLNSHQYKSLTGPNGEPVWESYVQNHAPSAWRIWWTYGPAADMITVTFIGPHP